MTSRVTKSNANSLGEVARAFAKTLNLGLLYADKNGAIKFINKKFERIFALAPKIFYGAKFDELVVAAQGLGELKSFESLKNSPLNSSDFIVKKDQKCYRLNVSNVLEGGVKFDGFILAVTDVTHEKELEKKGA
ncbi:PAS domain-containing protein [Campylobacter showae]|uniref:Putative two component sensor kinase n=1 Tax=Campylobacter showae CC57C TaxID=1073353 RepID=M3J7U5_9BACT|nr:PAS domain-containing protein [Campylobacter showae]EMG29453.1 putative two component sensor kinase [Campylobacter showae CC57C]